MELSAIIHAFPNMRVFTMEAILRDSWNALETFWPSLDYLGGHSDELAQRSISCRVHFLYLAPTLRVNEPHIPEA